MRKLIVVLGAVMVVTGLAAGSEQSDVMAPVHQFVDAFNKGDAKTALAACADQVFIIDEFAPYQWNGTGACSTWAEAYAADAKKNGITDGIVTFGKPRHIDVVEDHAYVVLPANYAYKQNGKQLKETGATLTIALQKTAAGWLITSWAWTKH